MLGAGTLFLLGAGLQAGAGNLAMLVAGRLVLGCGVGERLVECGAPPPRLNSLAAASIL